MALMVMSTGSSPRVRGEGSPAMLRRVFTGIIPAGAGRSAFVAWAQDESKDHPRGCGEKPTTEAGVIWRQGSSPRVRGEGNHCKI